MRKVKIIVQSFDGKLRRTTEVWSGEMDILNDTEYIAKISIIGEGEPQPLCDIPFAIGIGHYLWIPNTLIEDTEVEDDGYNFN